ncbi:MAG: hypothetical protein AABN95_02145 [Acidobacteriota bacterium]
MSIEIDDPQIDTNRQQTMMSLPLPQKSWAKRPRFGVRRLVGALAGCGLAQPRCARDLRQHWDLLHRTWRLAATGQSADKAAHSKGGASWPMTFEAKLILIDFVLDTL